MRKFLLSAFLFYCCIMLSAQMVPKFSYQAVVRNGNNELVTNEPITIQLTFFNATPHSSAVYFERHSVMSNANGLIHLMVGEGSSQFGTLDSVVWSEAYLCTNISISGGYEIFDTTRIAASPYAYYAEKIPLSAIQAHLGTAALVTTPALSDSLSHYLSNTDWQIVLDNYLPRSEFLDSLNHVSNNGTLGQILQHLQDEIDSLNSIASMVDEFSVSSTTANRFPLTHAPLTGREVQMYINGVHISTLAHTITNSTLIYLPVNNGNKALDVGDRVQIYYFFK